MSGSSPSLNGLAMLDRHIPLHRTFNTRDCGGYPAADGRYTRWRALLRSDCPLRLDAASVAALQEIGIRTSIDLRNAQEIRNEQTRSALDRMQGVRYLNIPLIPRFTQEGLPQDLREAYLLYVQKFQPQIRAILGALAAAELPLIVNCQVGKDRTGMIIALALGAVGVPLNVIVDDYALTEAYCRPLIPELLAEAVAEGYDSARYRRMLETPPEAMREALQWLEAEHGSIPNYLKAIGITEEELGALRDKLLVGHTQVSFSWRLPDERRTTTNFHAETHVYEDRLDRWLMRLLTPTAPVDAALPAEFRDAITALPGKWVRIPGEARRNNLTLPMKYETLTGRIRYFYAERPAPSA